MATNYSDQNLFIAAKQLRRRINAWLDKNVFDSPRNVAIAAFCISLFTMTVFYAFLFLIERAFEVIR